MRQAIGTLTQRLSTSLPTRAGDGDARDGAALFDPGGLRLEAPVGAGCRGFRLRMPSVVVNIHIGELMPLLDAGLRLLSVLLWGINAFLNEKQCLAYLS